MPWIAGTRLAVRRGMTGATGNIYCGLHEFEDMAFVLHFLRPQDCFVDIGANIGSYTILASGVCRACSIAFEPDPDTFAALSRNIVLNGLSATVKSKTCALGAEPGAVGFTVGLDTMNWVATAGSGPTKIVAMDILDHALEGQRPTLIKLDVEGFENEVLRGAAEALCCPQLKAIITEDRSPPVVAHLQAAGFVQRNYDPFTRRLSSERVPRQGSNALFVRDLEFVQERLVGAPPIRVLDNLL